MNSRKSKIYFKINFFIFLQLIVIIILEDCPRKYPILLNNGECVSLNCSENEFKTNYCIINNTIIKTQWLTNIILFGDLDFRYINFVTYSNGDMVAETTSYPGQPKRMFYGLKKNGRNFFKENTPFYSMTVQNQDDDGNKYESEIFIAKLNDGNDKDNEYIVSMTKSNRYAELYDFDNNKIYQKKLINITGVAHENLRNAALTTKSSDNKYYSLYGFTYGRNFYIFKFLFSSKNDIEENLNMNKKVIGDAKAITVSCFESENKIIICFYTRNDGTKKIYALDIDFNDKGENSISPKDSTYDKNSFIKCIHLTGEIGVFSFYDKIENSNSLYPFLYFKKYIDNGSTGVFENAISNLNQEYVVLDLYNFTRDILMNDLTKLSNSSICFTATDFEHETFFIIVLNIIQLKEIKIRYYSFQIYNLLYYKFLQDMKSYLYNQFVVIGSSVCRQKNCTSDHFHPHFSSLIFFSYPNSTDEDFDVSDYLFNNNNITIEGLEIDLKKYIKIENNIFGYIFYGIKIFNISDNNVMKLYSSKYDNTVINENYTLKIDESIKIKFENYVKVNCSFYYSYIITEPKRDIFDTYPSDIELKYGNDTEEYFNSQKKQYIGRSSYFNIYLKDYLDVQCSESCDLCLKDKPDFCITCRNNYYFKLYDNKTKIKKCNQTILNYNSTIISINTESSEKEFSSSDYSEKEKEKEQEKEKKPVKEKEPIKEEEIETEKELEKEKEKEEGKQK